MKLTSKLISLKTTKHSWLLPNLLVIIFVMAQVASITHQADHLNADADNSCLLCINTVDHAINADSLELVNLTVNFIKPNTTIIYFTNLDINVNYSSRAPPIA
jgi:hypothetical protein